MSKIVPLSRPLHHIEVWVGGAVVGAAAGEGLADHRVARNDYWSASHLHRDLDLRPQLTPHVPGHLRRRHLPVPLEVEGAPGT